jgi:hypothetical protein
MSTNTLRTSTAIPSHQETPQERHSCKSLHSRSQSRLSTAQPKKQRDRSRTQSTTFPYFDLSTLELPALNIGNAITTATDAACMVPKSSKPSRDLSGKLTCYGMDEDFEIGS